MEQPRVDGVSVLDVLAVWPCARAVFEHVPVRALVRSERVSRHWQHAVHDYLQATRNLKLYYGYIDLNKSNHRSIEIENHDSSLSLLSKLVEKLGSYLVSVNTDSSITEHLRVIEANCHHLQHVGIYRQPDIVNKLEKFEMFKKITSLGLNECHNLGAKEFEYISNLQNLTSLELNDNGVEVLQNIHELLFRMPQLENVSLRRYESIPSRKELLASLSLLRNLKRLDLTDNDNVDDELIEAVVWGCRKLEYLNITNANQACMRSLAAMCRRPPPGATTLCMGYIQNFTSEDLAWYIRCRSVIKELEALGCVELTPHWLETSARASQGRQHPLKLRPNGQSAGQVEQPLNVVLCSAKIRKSPACFVMS